ncbi:MAG: transglutaminase domain-containing protein [Lachnospiraceae bacterium]|nr:transglutaminase domain-containing protein [Lachnospiraceae bacterium]
MSDLKKELYAQFSFLWLIFMPAVPFALYLSTMNVTVLQPMFFLSYLLVFFLIGLITFVKEIKGATWYLMGAVVIAIGVIFRDWSTLLNCVMALGFYAVMWFLSRSKKMIRIPVNLVMMAVLTILWILQKDAQPVVVVCLLGILLSSVQELTVKEQKYGLVPVILLQLILVFLPVKEEPLKWTVLINFAQRMEERAEIMYQDTAYLFEGMNLKGISVPGYSNAGSLGGLTVGKPREDLYLKSDVNDNYLRGKCYEELTRDGAATVCTDPVYNASLAKTLNALYAHDVSGEMAECFVRNEHASVTYHYLRTRDVLAHTGTFSIDEEYRDGLDKLSYKGLEVDYNFLYFDYANPYLIDIMRNPVDATADYDTICDYGKAVLRIDPAKYMTEEEYETALSYDPGKMAEYLDASMATERIISLTEDITKGCDTDYDKAKAIEQYLREYEYRTDVDLSGRANYIEDFLFETQSGYCVHFASAMTLMLRVSGIPSRYCIGYIHQDRKEKAVLSTEAHAWPEAYIGNLGWVSFEPTATYRNAEGHAWGKKLKDPDKEKDPDDYFEYEPDIPYHPPIDPSAYRDQEPREPEELKSKVDWEMIRLFSTYLAMLLTVLILILVLYRVIRHVYYKRLSPEDKMRADVLTIRKRLERNLPEGTKVESFDQYLAVISDPDLKGRLKEIFARYYRMRFREETIGEDYVSTVHTFARELAKKRKL